MWTKVDPYLHIDTEVSDTEVSTCILKMHVHTCVCCSVFVDVCVRGHLRGILARPRK